MQGADGEGRAVHFFFRQTAQGVGNTFISQEEVAIAAPQPLILNFTSAMMSFSILRKRRRLSPQLGSPT
jgi:hypothetical protein